jgi:hypothetical protein
VLSVRRSGRGLGFTVDRYYCQREDWYPVIQIHRQDRQVTGDGAGRGGGMCGRVWVGLGGSAGWSGLEEVAVDVGVYERKCESASGCG